MVTPLFRCNFVLSIVSTVISLLLPSTPCCAQGVGGTGTPGRVPVWTDTVTIGDSLITQSGSYIGIGTSTPSGLLNIRGDSPSVSVENNGMSQAAALGLFHDEGGIRTYGTYLYSNAVTANFQVVRRRNLQDFAVITIANDTGNVGIGNANPQAALDISGDILAHGLPVAPDRRRIDVANASGFGCPSAVPDDGIDHTNAFVCALNALSPTGGVLHIPSGTFIISSTLAVPGRVTVVGDGFGTNLQQAQTLAGPLFVMYSSSSLRHIKLTQIQPTPGPGWSPDSRYDYQIKVVDSDIIIEDVQLLNPFKGILIANSAYSIGRIRLTNIRGQPLYRGIEIDNATDVIYIDNVHFWPYWSQVDDVYAYQQSNGIAILSKRDDNPQFSKLFFFAYYKGISFDSSNCAQDCGITSAPKIVQMDCDACQIGIDISGTLTQGVFVTEFGSSGYSRSGIYYGTGVNINADYVTMIVNQAMFGFLGGNAIRVRSSGVTVQVQNVMVREWNTTRQGFPAFELVQPSSDVYFSVQGFVFVGHGAPDCSANVICSVTHRPL